jgi:hypothetical protein
MQYHVLFLTFLCAIASVIIALSTAINNPTLTPELPNRDRTR